MEKQYHIACSQGEVGGYVLLPGDPARCKAVAALFDEARFVAQNREFVTYTGTLCGTAVSVCSTGIGGPSSAIAMEELSALGAHTFLRIGTCGGIALPVKSGDLVIATGAVRQDGTSAEYAPLSFPAVSDFEVTSALVASARAAGVPFHTGVVQSKDSFYGQHSPGRMPTEFALLSQWEAWKRLGVLASEMEAAAQFTVAAALGRRAGAIFYTVWNQERKAAGLDPAEDANTDTSRMLSVAVSALRILIEADKK